MGKQAADRSRSKQVPRNAAKYQFPDPAVPIGAGYDQVSVLGLGQSHHLVGRRCCRMGGDLGRNGDPVPAEIGRQVIKTGSNLILASLVIEN
jgi:hypothetical protein